MDEREHRIRERAHQLWEEERCPEGRAEDHWYQAKEIVAMEEGRPKLFKPVDAAEAVPAEALTNAGKFPTLTDQGEMEIPHRPEPAADIDPNVAMDNAANEPVSESDTIRSTLEVPPQGRGKRSSVRDAVGAMTGDAGRRLRS